MGRQYLKNNNCPLCQKEKITKWYYEDDLFWVADCKTCKVPMIVLKRHSVRLTQEEWDRLEVIFKELEKSGISGAHDYRRRAIPNHWHIHIRYNLWVRSRKRK